MKTGRGKVQFWAHSGFGSGTHGDSGRTQRVTEAKSYLDYVLGPEPRLWKKLCPKVKHPILPHSLEGHSNRDSFTVTTKASGGTWDYELDGC